MSKMSNVYSIYVFYKVCNALKYKDVSDELNITTSSISQHVKKVEHYFNRVLLIRTTREIKLTPDGDAFFRKIKGSFENIENAINTLEDDTVTICGTSSIILDIITPIINKYNNSLNNLSFKHVDDSEHNEDFIITYGEVDISGNHIYESKTVSCNDTLSLFGPEVEDLGKSKFILVNNRHLIHDFECWCEHFNVDINKLEIISVFNVKQAVELLENNIAKFVVNKSIMSNIAKGNEQSEWGGYSCKSPNKFYLYSKVNLSRNARELKDTIEMELNKYFSNTKGNLC